MSIYNDSPELTMGQSRQNPPGQVQQASSLRYENFFSPQRWWMLVTLHWAENRKRYLLALPAIAGVLFVWYSFLIMMNKGEPLSTPFQVSAYYVGLFLIGSLYGSMLFSELGHKARSIQYLSVPASQFEKLLCALFFGVLLFFIVYTLLYYLVDIPMVGLSNRISLIRGRHLGDSGRIFPNGHPVQVYNVFTNKGGPLPNSESNYFLLIYFALQAAFILGSIYFMRYSFIKTVVSLLLLVLVYMLFVIKGIVASLPQGWHFGPSLFEWSQVREFNGQEEEKLVRLSSWIGNTCTFLIKYSLPFVFWSITYIRLKEKEV